MKTLKVICIQLVLAVFLSVSAHAGDVSTPGMTAPTPIPSPTAEMSEDSGATLTDPVSSTSGAFDSADLIQLFAALIF